MRDFNDIPLAENDFSRMGLGGVLAGEPGTNAPVTRLDPAVNPGEDSQTTDGQRDHAVAADLTLGDLISGFEHHEDDAPLLTGDGDAAEGTTSALARLTEIRKATLPELGEVEIREMSFSQESEPVAQGEAIEHLVGCACPACGMRSEEDVIDHDASGPNAATITSAAPAASATLLTLATYLNDINTGGSDYWNEAGLSYSPSFNLTSSGAGAKSGTLHYNVSGFSSIYGAGTDTDGLTSARADMVRHALDIYEDILGINFVETTSMDTNVVDIFFKDNDANRAYASFLSYTSNYATAYSWVNIDENWSGGSSSIGSYSFQTALHEIGHVLGLGHQGQYNGSGGYASDAYWQNDSWQQTMMSYFSQNGNTDVDASYARLIGPMAVDWLALDQIYGSQGYGVDNGTTTGDTVWGFNSTWSQWSASSAGPGTNTSNSAYASLSSLLSSNATSIVDAGGIDTLDLSGFANNSLIDLRIVASSSTTGSISSVAGLIGNLTLSVGTVIENFVGGAGGETIYANAADNDIQGQGGDDTIYGYAGDDTVFGGEGNDFIDGGGDTDEAGYAGNRDFYVATELQGGGLQIVDNRSQSQLTADGSNAADGTDTVYNFELFQFQNAEYTYDGLLGQADTMNDFDGNGSSDILWRNSVDGTTAFWAMDSGAYTSWESFGTVAKDLEVAATGDLDGNGFVDILWQSSSTGAAGFYKMDSSGETWTSLGDSGLDWEIAGAGDFNGDNEDDVVWRNTADGTTGYRSLNDGTPTWKGLGKVGLTWEVAGTGDFDGNGDDDFLWRDMSAGTTGYWGMDSGSVASWKGFGQVGLSWDLLGTGDFDGNGEDDILWQNSANGTTGYWEMTNGNAGWHSFGAVASNWDFAGTGDFDGNGDDDILWRDNANGKVGYWAMNNGSQTWSPLVTVAMEWETPTATYDDIFV